MFPGFPVTLASRGAPRWRPSPPPDRCSSPPGTMRCQRFRGGSARPRVPLYPGCSPPLALRPAGGYAEQLVAAHHRLAAYDLRHAALSLWLASGAPPAEIAARAGHSVRVLLTIYAHGIPGCDQIASQHIDRALRPSRWPPAGPRTGADARIPSAIRPCHSRTQRDTAGPDPSA